MERPTYVNSKNQRNEISVAIPFFGSVSGVEMLVKEEKSLMEKFMSNREEDVKK